MISTGDKYPSFFSMSVLFPMKKGRTLKKKTPRGPIEFFFSSISPGTDRRSIHFSDISPDSFGVGGNIGEMDRSRLSLILRRHAPANPFMRFAWRAVRIKEIQDRCPERSGVPYNSRKERLKRGPDRVFSAEDLAFGGEKRRIKK